MATIGNDPGGRRRILFVGPAGKRHTIRLGKVSERIAQTILLKVESLLAAKVAHQPVDRETAAWLAEIDDRLHDRLARAELASRRTSAPPQAGSLPVMTPDSYLPVMRLYWPKR